MVLFLQCNRKLIYVLSLSIFTYLYGLFCIFLKKTPHTQINSYYTQNSYLWLSNNWVTNTCPSPSQTNYPMLTSQSKSFKLIWFIEMKVLKRTEEVPMKTLKDIWTLSYLLISWAMKIFETDDSDFKYHSKDLGVIKCLGLLQGDLPGREVDNLWLSSIEKIHF